jgi:hypothetical protein
MPGARLASFRFGDRSELLVELLLSALAFTTRVPRQEDIGFDFFCSLITEEGNLLKAGPFFSVQAKSSLDPIIYEKEHELTWITTQENPLLICVADRPSLAVEIYSTWNLLCGPLAKRPTRLILKPGMTSSEFPGVIHKPDGSQEICLGSPVLRVTDEDISNDVRRQQIAAVLGRWVALDRTNIVNRQAGIYWVVGPLSYQTGQTPEASNALGVAFYWNIQNLDQCTINLGRISTALSLLLRDGLSSTDAVQPVWVGRIEALRLLIRAYWLMFDEQVRNILTQQGLQP